MSGSGLAYDIMDVSATLAGRAAFANKTDNSDVVPESNWGTVAGAGLFDLYDDYFIDINEFFRGTKFAPGPICIGGLASTAPAASAGADDIVARGVADVGVSLISTSTVGKCEIAFGDPDSSTAGVIRFDHQFNALYNRFAGSIGQYYQLATAAFYDANVTFQVGKNDDPNNAGSPLQAFYKAATGTAFVQFSSNEGGTFQARSREGLDASENHVVQIFNTSGVLQGTTTWVAGSTTVTFPGSVTLGGVSPVLALGDSSASAQPVIQMLGGTGKQTYHTWIQGGTAMWYSGITANETPWSLYRNGGGGSGKAIGFDHAALRTELYDTTIRLVTAGCVLEWASGGPVDAAGSGTPEGVLTAPVGSTYRRTNGGAGTSFYVKESGTGNTGWVGK